MISRRACLGLLSLTLPIGPAQAAPPPLGAEERADWVVVEKAARRLHLVRAGQVVRSYEISLGTQPLGPKTRAGDARTPEGQYVIDWRNPASAFHLSLHISYPNAADQTAAALRGEDPGGMIMIHGLPNGRGYLGPLHRLRDWTNGCIAVTNAEIREIWDRVPDGTPIDIRP